MILANTCCLNVLTYDDINASSLIIATGKVLSYWTKHWNSEKCFPKLSYTVPYEHPVWIIVVYYNDFSL